MEDKIEVSVELIKEVHEVASEEIKDILEGEFPDLFKFKLEVGKWYKRAHSLMVWNGGEYTYGFFDGEYGDYWNLNNGFNLEPATEEEVGDALKAEAYKRRYGIGTCLSGHGANNISSDYFTFVGCFNTLYGLVRYNGLSRSVPIFKDGKWTEIIDTKKTMTISEIEEELGYSIKIVK
tara:strand:+ start:724 stop:1257 length:534 start_codon:yes stop_codon:yes gene_type:complete